MNKKFFGLLATICLVILPCLFVFAGCFGGPQEKYSITATFRIGTLMADKIVIQDTQGRQATDDDNVFIYSANKGKGLTISLRFAEGIDHKALQTSAGISTNLGYFVYADDNSVIGDDDEVQYWRARLWIVELNEYSSKDIMIDATSCTLAQLMLSLPDDYDMRYQAKYAIKKPTATGFITQLNSDVMGDMQNFGSTTGKAYFPYGSTVYVFLGSQYNKLSYVNTESDSNVKEASYFNGKKYYYNSQSVFSFTNIKRSSLLTEYVETVIDLEEPQFVSNKHNLVNVWINSNETCVTPIWYHECEEGEATDTINGVHVKTMTSWNGSNMYSNFPVYIGSKTSASEEEELALDPNLASTLNFIGDTLYVRLDSPSKRIESATYAYFLAHGYNDLADRQDLSGKVMPATSGDHFLVLNKNDLTNFIEEFDANQDGTTDYRGGDAFLMIEPSLGNYDEVVEFSVEYLNGADANLVVGNAVKLGNDTALINSYYSGEKKIYFFNITDFNAAGKKLKVLVHKTGTYTIPSVSASVDAIFLNQSILTTPATHTFGAENEAWIEVDLSHKDTGALNGTLIEITYTPISPDSSTHTIDTSNLNLGVGEMLFVGTDFSDPLSFTQVTNQTSILTISASAPLYYYFVSISGASKELSLTTSTALDAEVISFTGCFADLDGTQISQTTGGNTYTVNFLSIPFAYITAECTLYLSAK